LARGGIEQWLATAMALGLWQPVKTGAAEGADQRVTTFLLGATTAQQAGARQDPLLGGTQRREQLSEARH
jgi:hypothetical protein